MAEAENRDSTQSPLIVVVHPMPPFVIQQKNGKWAGLGVQLWRVMADELQIRFVFEEIPADFLVQAVHAGHRSCHLYCGHP